MSKEKIFLKIEKFPKKGNFWQGINGKFKILHFFQKNMLENFFLKKNCLVLKHTTLKIDNQRRFKF
jgi:hypothetical protein